MIKRFLDIDTTHRLRDDNGYLIVKDNPIAKSGVFEYLLSEVMPNFNKTQNDCVVKVYRPFETLENAKDSFANKPIMFQHEWLGDEVKQADGAIGSNIILDKENGYLRADLIIYNVDLINKIENGEVVELSPAYTGHIENQSGRFEGEDYQYIQTIECVNHLAVVENGRSGNDLRILDSQTKELIMAKFKDELNALVKKFLDNDNVETETQDSEAEGEAIETKDNLAETILEIAKQDISDDEKLAKIGELLNISTQDSETETCDTDSQDSEAETEVKDNVETTQGEAIDKEALAEVIAEAVKKEVAEFKDSINKVQDSYKKVSQAIGSHFDYSNKSADDIYALGYEILSGNKLANGLNAETAFNVVATNKRASFSDSAIKDVSNSKILDMLKKM